MKRFLVLSLLIVWAVFPAQAQTGRGRATAATPAVATGNDEVIKLVQACMSEDVVLAFIAGTDKAKFDRSAAGLLKLKDAKVSDRVIAAVMGIPAVPASAPAPPRPTASEPPLRRVEVVPGRPSTRAVENREAGIYWDNGASMVQLEPAVFASEGTGGKFLNMITTLFKASIKAKVRSPEANQRITDTQPVFYFHFENKGAGLSNTGGGMFTGFMTGASSPNEFVLVQMKVEKRERSIVTGESWTFSDSNGVRSKDVVDISFEKLRDGVYKVTPKYALAPGEYCFFYAAGNLERGGNGKLFDFGVDGPPVAASK